MTPVFNAVKIASSFSDNTMALSFSVVKMVSSFNVLMTLIFNVSDRESTLITDNDRPWTFQEVCEAFNAVASLGPSVIVIDGLDEIGGTLGKTIRQVCPSIHAMLPELFYIPHISAWHLTFTDFSASTCKIVCCFCVSCTTKQYMYIHNQ